MTDFSLTHAVEVRQERTAAVHVAETELRVTHLIDLAKDAIKQREPALIEAVFTGFAGVPMDYSVKDETLWNGALRNDIDKVRTELIATFIDADPRRAAECFNRYIGHGSENPGFFNAECFASEFVMRALRNLGDTPDELAFVRKVFTRALKDVASVLMMDRDAEIPHLADDAAAILKKLRAVPAYADDVDAATRAIIRGLRQSDAKPEHIAIYQQVSPATMRHAPERPKRKRDRSKAASHDS